jgi:hypothetical protein
MSAANLNNLGVVMQTDRWWRIILLSLFFLSLGCAADQQSVEGEDQAEITKKEAFDSPSRHHIPSSR